MRNIADIPSGKRGNTAKRHPMEMVEDFPLPHDLLANSPTEAAALFCSWVDELKQTRYEDFQWLLSKWLFASEKEFGRIRLSEDEEKRWRTLPECVFVKPIIEIKEFKDSKAKVGLKEIPEGHPFYNLKGKDNIVMFYTERYPEQPLIIKGAGAGADVTASGLFADIIKVAKN